MTGLSTRCLAFKMSYLLINKANEPYKCLDFQRLLFLTGIRCHPQVKGLIKECPGNFLLLLKALCCLAKSKIFVVASQLTLESSRGC